MNTHKPKVKLVNLGSRVQVFERVDYRDQAALNEFFLYTWGGKRMDGPMKDVLTSGFEYEILSCHEQKMQRAPCQVYAIDPVTHRLTFLYSMEENDV